MKKIMLPLTGVLAFLVLTVGTQNVEVVNANPVVGYWVPDIWVGYPSSIGGYVNSTVEFEVYVYMHLDSPTLDKISYSVDGQPEVTVDDLTVEVVNERVYNGSNAEKMDFKKYTGNIRLENLTEGPHTLVAYAKDMSDDAGFTVNSHYVIAELTMLSPVTQVYWEPIPLIFNINGEISDAHYYIYQDKELISENTLNGNTTIGSLPEGNYELLLFVTTQHGQTSEKTQFSVSNSNLLENLSIIAGVIVTLAFGIVVGVFFIKKAKFGQTNSGLFAP